MRTLSENEDYKKEFEKMNDILADNMSASQYLKAYSQLLKLQKIILETE